MKFNAACVLGAKGTELAIATCGTTFDLIGVPQASGTSGQTKTLRMALTSAVGSKEK
jgi:hypothetical protein